MRVYELAAKIGTTSQTVMRLAGENDVEVYSPLSSLESEDVDATLFAKKILVLSIFFNKLYAKHKFCTTLTQNRHLLTRFVIPLHTLIVKRQCGRIFHPKTLP